MSGGVASGVLVSALVRRVNDAGGLGMVRARGESGGGAILLILHDRTTPPYLRERAIDLDGKPVLRPAGPAGTVELAIIEDYWRARRTRDPDLWVVELDIVGAERFAAETILGG